MLDEVVHNDKNFGIRRDQTRRTSGRPDSPVITLSKEELRSLIMIGVNKTAEGTQRGKMRSMLRNLVEKLICGLFGTGYCALAENVNAFSFSFAESVTTKTIYCGGLDETLSLCFIRWSQSESYTKENASNPSFITPVAAFITESVINTVEEMLKGEP